MTKRLRFRAPLCRRVILCAALLAAFGGAVAAFGQTQGALHPRLQKGRKLLSSGNIRLDVKLVLTPVTVSDGFDRPLSELHKSNFRIFEDGVEQEIASFSISEAPVSVGLVFDSSRSMRNSIADSREAVNSS